MAEAFEVRIAVLWPHWTGYMDAGLQALHAMRPSEALIAQRALPADAPFDLDLLPAARRARHVACDEGWAVLNERLEEFAPNIILTCSWDNRHYRRLCRRWAGRAVRVMHMDNQWFGTAKQWGGVVVSPFFVQPLADYAFVPGERQARFARRLGFEDERILYGSYTGDRDMFAPHAAKPLDERKAFLCVARLAPEKGIDRLVEAYETYRARVDEPWPLIVCGTGQLSALLEDVEGVDLRGFVQPAELPSVFAEAACQVLPSLFEPYAVVLHEAAMAGMGIVCTDACGAGDRFVDPTGVNGRVVPRGDTAALTDAMVAMSTRDAATLEVARRRSCELGAMVSPQSWATSLLRALEGGNAAAG